MFGTSTRMLCVALFVVLALGGGDSFVYGRPQGSPKDQLNEQDLNPGPIQEPPLMFHGERTPLDKVSGPSSMYPYYPPPSAVNNRPPEKATTTTTTTTDKDANGQAKVEDTKQGNPATNGNNFHNTFFNSHKKSDKPSAVTSRNNRQPQPPSGVPDLSFLKKYPNLHVPHVGDESDTETGSGAGPLTAEDLEDDLGLPVDRPINSEEEDLGLSPYLRTRKPPQLPFQPSKSRPVQALRPDAPHVHLNFVSGSVPEQGDAFLSWEQLMNKDVGIDWPLTSEDDFTTTKPGQKGKAKLSKAAKRGSVTASTTERSKAKHHQDSKHGEDKAEGLVSEDGVPIELAVGVIEAMQAEPKWKQHLDQGAVGNWQEPWDEDDDDFGEDADWIPTGSTYPQDSRLVGLIMESIDDSDVPMEQLKDIQQEDKDILEIFSNFPLQMLFGVQNDNNADDEEDDFFDEYYEDYDDDTDDENYAVSLEADGAKNPKSNPENESDEYDTPYSDEYEGVGFVEETEGEISIIAVLLSPLM